MLESTKMKTFLYLVFWIATACVLLMPHGVLHKIQDAERWMDVQKQADPTGFLCYKCYRAAVQSASYSDGSIRYFCAQHPPPKLMNWDTDEPDRSRFSTKGCYWIIGVVLGIGFIRFITISFVPGISWKLYFWEAAIALVFTVLNWMWFHHVSTRPL